MAVLKRTAGPANDDPGKKRKVTEADALRIVRVRAGDLIDQIEFVFNSGQRRAWGGSGGHQQQDFQLQAGEHLVRIEWRAGDSLDAVRFVTDTGRTSQWYGNTHGGSLQTPLVSSDGLMIVGIIRSDAGFCPRLQGIETAPGALQGKEHFLFLGNPGSGKSTILNGVIGEPLFASGPSFDGKGVTTKFDQRDVPGKGIFMDTPGLSDEKLRTQAANAITEALKQNGFYRIFFVVTCDAGRVKPDDKTTIKLILDAAPTITEYSIIVNQVTKTFIQTVHMTEFMATFMEGLPKVTASIRFMQRKDELENGQNVQYNAPDDVVEFIKNAPGMHIKSSDVTDVKTDVSDSIQKEHDERVKQMEARNAERERAQRLREQRFREEQQRREWERQQMEERARRERQEMEARLERARRDAAQAARERASARQAAARRHHDPCVLM